VTHGKGDGVLSRSSGVEGLKEDHQKVYGGPDAHREQKGREDLRRHTHWGTGDGHGSEGREDGEDDDHQRQQYGRGAPEQQKQQHRDREHREPGEQPDVLLHLLRDAVGHDGRAGVVQLEVGAAVLGRQGFHGPHHLCALVPGDEGGLGRPSGSFRVVFVEAVHVVRIAAHRRIGRGLHDEGHDAPVVGDQQAPVQRIREHAPLETGQLRGGLGPLLEQVPHDEILALTSRLARVDQARDLVEVWHLLLEIGVEVAQLRQEAQVEDLGRLHRYDDCLLAAELPAEAVVHHAGGIVLAKQGLGGGLDLEPPDLGAESQRRQRHHDDDRPGMPGHDAPPI